MGALLERIKSIMHDRRKGVEQVQEDRRRKATLRDADERLHGALEKLDRTIRMRRKDFEDMGK